MSINNTQSDMLQQHKKEIIKENNMISLYYNGYQYSLLLNELQEIKFNKDFADDNKYYDFTFWKPAIFLFGVRRKIDDLP